MSPGGCRQNQAASLFLLMARAALLAVCCSTGCGSKCRQSSGRFRHCDLRTLRMGALGRKASAATFVFCALVLALSNDSCAAWELCRDCKASLHSVPNHGPCFG